MVGKKLSLFAAATAVASLAHAASPDLSTPDPFLWLEEVKGERALHTVAGWTERTRRELAAAPDYDALHRDARKVLDEPARLVAPQPIGADVYRFWQDEAHPRGVWQRAGATAYRSGRVNWETVLDIGQLSAAEGVAWFWRGALCRPPAFDRCLVVLSEEGKDTLEAREYDLAARRFVEGGLRSSPATKAGPTHLEVHDLPIDWIDPDTAILTRIWTPGEETAAGYGYVVKTLRRGEPLEAAREVFRGSPTDVSVMPLVFRDGAGRQVVVVSRRLGFFEAEYHVLTASGSVLMPFPKGVTVRGLVDGRLVATLRTAWTRPDGSTLPAGAVVALDVDQAIADPTQVAPELIMAPGERQAIDQVIVTRDRVVVGYYENVEGRVSAYTRGKGGWSGQALPVPPMSGVRLVAGGNRDDSFTFITESFLEPPAIYLADAVRADARRIEAAPAQFDASRHVVEQYEATAKDGVKIPYFVVRPKGLAFDGGAPTTLCSYGGLGYILAPRYYPVTGKLWLERGGVTVYAHIRGGGEFGPSWHQVAQRAKRQVTFDDFASVAEDLIRRRITSPPHLAVKGASNSGLLAGVEFTQRPDLWNAAVINVGLLDMVRFTRMLAGASWISEFGNPDDPVEGAFLRRISPYHQLKPGVSYPPPFIVTSTADDRVHPAHSRKFAARLEQLGRPFYYVETPTGGHEAGGEGGPCGATGQADLEYAYLAQRLMRRRAD